MLVMNQVLTDNGYFKEARGLPCQTEIQFGIAWYGAGCRDIIVVNGVDPTKRTIKRQTQRQVHGGPDKHLMLGIGSFTEAIAQIATRPNSEMLPQNINSRMQSPPVERLPGKTGLESIGVPLKIILEQQRQCTARAEVQGPEVVILIIEPVD
jgi:hypothetical protein